MTQSKEKEVVCDKHRQLLYLLLRYGNGFFLLPQLRELCLELGLYSSEQTVNRAVRALTEAGVLARQTWIDNNSSFLLARKYAARYFTGKSSQEAATPRRPTTMAPYILQARKVGLLLELAPKAGVKDMEGLEDFLRRTRSTIFLRVPELAEYYRQNSSFLGQENRLGFLRQLERLEAGNAQRRGIVLDDGKEPTVPLSLITMEQSHRRGLYIFGFSKRTKTVHFILFAGRQTRPENIVTWAIDAFHAWIAPLLPYWRAHITVDALDMDHKESLQAALSAPAAGTITPYWQYRLEGDHLAGQVEFALRNSEFVNRWCGGVHRIDL